MKGYMVMAEDIRGHFCLGRVFLTEDKAKDYCRLVNTEMKDKHIDTAEGGHYFIFSADVFEVEIDEEVLDTQKEIKE